MHTTLCPGIGCSKADTCVRAIRYTLEPNAPSRSSDVLDPDAWKPSRWEPGQIRECLYYFADSGKRATNEPNIANLIGEYVFARLPGLANYTAAWVTGSTAWRVAYAMPLAARADLDVFVCDAGQYAHVVNMLRGIETEAPAQKPKRRGSMEGERIHTVMGWVDVWMPRPVNMDEVAAGPLLDPEPAPIFDPFRALLCYPPSTHAHCRVAYNPSTRSVIVIANEYANDEGAAEYHERAAQWHVVEAERLIKLARRSA